MPMELPKCGDYNKIFTQHLNFILAKDENQKS